MLRLPRLNASKNRLSSRPDRRDIARYVAAGSVILDLDDLRGEIGKVERADGPAPYCSIVRSVPRPAARAALPRSGWLIGVGMGLGEFWEPSIDGRYRFQLRFHLGSLHCHRRPSTAPQPTP